MVRLLVAGRAAHSHWQQTGSVEQAWNAAWGAFVRWSVWSVALGLWFFEFAAIWIQGNSAVNLRGASAGSVIASLVLLFAITPFTFGVTWCRIIDFCLFRQGLIYKLYAPIALMVEPVPTFAFYLLLPVPLVIAV